MSDLKNHCRKGISKAALGLKTYVVCHINGLLNI